MLKPQRRSSQLKTARSKLWAKNHAPHASPRVGGMGRKPPKICMETNFYTGMCSYLHVFNTCRYYNPQSQAEGQA